LKAFASQERKKKKWVDNEQKKIAITEKENIPGDDFGKFASSTGTTRLYTVSSNPTKRKKKTTPKNKNE
jgi:hypothetical protein